jgi:hypothetical protein
MRLQSALSVVLTVVSALAVPPAARAAELAGVTVPDSTRLGDATLVLNGTGLRSKLFIKVYVGALYLPARDRDAGHLLATDAVRRMELHFVRNVTTKQLCDSWKEGLEANSPGAAADLVAKFDRLCTAMADVHEGSVLALTYAPGTGTEIAFDGQAKATVEGEDFADALLRCWIGPEPGPGEDFKNGVLGR